MAESESRPFDLVVWGATGYTGSLAARWLQERYGGSDLRWAVAGRNRAKLDALIDDLSGKAPHHPRPRALLADAHDPAGLRELVRKTRVILSTVGPFSLYGTPLVEACVASGTDYCDITGEVLWVRELIDRYQLEAQASGARIVNCCGFDSIPSDLGTYVVVQALKDEYGLRSRRVFHMIEHIRGQMSGGTYASMLHAMETAASDKSIRTRMADPYLLVHGEERGSDRDQRGIRFLPAFESWTIPFIMAITNVRVVHRSNSLMDEPYGSPFSYMESMGTGRGAPGFLRALSMMGALASFAGMASTKVGRRILRPLLPEPGTGPSEAARRKSSFQSILLAESEASGGGEVKRMFGRVCMKMEPGYEGTARMLVESGMCLAGNFAGVRREGGFWTPASAFGRALVDRLREVDIHFTTMKSRP